MSKFFDELVMLGDMTPESRLNYYSAIEGTYSDSERQQLKKFLKGDPLKRFYEAREAIFAFIDPSTKQLVPSSNISPQKNLIGQTLNVTLDKFYIHRYPGSPKHIIQINFSVGHLVNVANATSDSTLVKEDILFGYIVEAVDGQAAPPVGAALFRKLKIQDELQMTVITINLADRLEKRISEVLEGEVMKGGLDLLSTANPAFSMVRELVEGTTKMFLERHRNIVVHKVPIGLLINAKEADPKLREGSYALMQAASDWFNLEDFCWNTERYRIEHKKSKEQLPCNHIVFSISKS